jgi:hypothetical protein
VQVLPLIPVKFRKEENFGSEADQRERTGISHSASGITRALKWQITANFSYISFFSMQYSCKFPFNVSCFKVFFISVFKLIFPIEKL